MIQPKSELMKSRVEHVKTETIVQRQRDPRLARQMQFQNSTQRNFPQRNRTAPHGPGIQRFGPPSTSFVSNMQSDNNVANRPITTFNAATTMDDSGRQSRPTSKNRISSKDLKNRLTSKTSPKSSHKSNNQKSPSSKTASTPTKSPSSKTSKSSKVTSPSNRSSKDLKKDRYKEKDTNKLSPSRNSATVPLAEAEKKMKEYTIPFKKRSPSPKDKSTKSITDPKVSSTTKTTDSPVKFKGGKANSKSRNYVRRNRDESPVANKDGVEVVQQNTPPSPPMSSTTTTTTELITSPIPPPLIEPITGTVSSVPFTGVAENQSFKSKDNAFIVRMVKISHIVHSMLTRLMISNRLINYCINHRDDILNKFIVIGTGDNFFIKTFLPFFLFNLIFYNLKFFF